VLAAIFDPLRPPFVAVGLEVGEATLRRSALDPLRLALTALVLDREPAFGTALDALAVTATTLGAHHLALASACALDLALTAATTFHTLGAELTTATAALCLCLTVTAAALRLGLSATATLHLSLTVSAVAPVGLCCCRRGNRKGRDTGRENEVPHLESPNRFAVTTTRDTRRSTLR
jgi:hypothetical protein